LLFLPLNGGQNIECSLVFMLK